MKPLPGRRGGRPYETLEFLGHGRAGHLFDFTQDGESFDVAQDPEVLEGHRRTTGCDNIGTRRSLLQQWIRHRKDPPGSPWNERKDTNVSLVPFDCGQRPALGTMLYPLLFRNFYYDTHAAKGAFNSGWRLSGENDSDRG